MQEADVLRFQISMANIICVDVVEEEEDVRRQANSDLASLKTRRESGKTGRPHLPHLKVLQPLWRQRILKCPCPSNWAKDAERYGMESGCPRPCCNFADVELAELLGAEIESAIAGLLWLLFQPRAHQTSAALN